MTAPLLEPLLGALLRALLGVKLGELLEVMLGVLLGVLDALGDADGAYAANCSGRPRNAGTRSPSLQVGVSVQGFDLQHLYGSATIVVFFGKWLTPRMLVQHYN